MLASCYNLLKWKSYLWPCSLQRLEARAHESVIPFPALFCLRRDGKAYLLLLGGIPHFPAGNDDSHHRGSSHPLVCHQWDHRKQQRQASGALLDVFPRPVGSFLMGGRHQNLKWCFSASAACEQPEIPSPTARVMFSAKTAAFITFTFVHKWPDNKQIHKSS